MTDLDYYKDNPNSRYSPVDLGSWNSISDVDTFLNRFNHDNGYKDGDTKLGVGDYVTINYGPYNTVWAIAGFDMEHNRTASDGTVYDNGYGICMIPKAYVTSKPWNDINTIDGAYISSTIHTTYIPSIVTTIRNILGDHIVNRNVLLSSSVGSNSYSNAYMWTTSDATLVSVSQIKVGALGSYRNQYDDGEANYLLPLYTHIDYIGYPHWTRSIWGKSGTSFRIWSAGTSGSIGYNVCTGTAGVCSLIYLR